MQDTLVKWGTPLPAGYAGGLECSQDNITPATSKLCCELLHIFVGPADFEHVLRTQRAVKMLGGMLARANSVCMLAFPRSGRRVLALLLVRVDCAVLCCACGENKVNKFTKVPQQMILPSAITG